ncbi:MAG: hypothetical protein MUO34_07850 [Ignavibacteriaceae bacterium]|nr:hypothetical protein [Ignavibacteriaceae bacterium]
MEKSVLRTTEIEKNVGLNIDPIGFLFKYDGRIFRAINNSKKAEVLFLFNSGAITELNEANLIPYTKISDIQLEGHDLVLEHKKIDVVTYSTEWSFELLKEAARLIIQVNKVLFKYDYETKDAHSHNVVFDKCIPKYVDIGSFQKRKNRKYWECKDEFFRTFLFPLKIWSSGNSQFARKSISDVADYLYRYEYRLYKYPVFRLVPIKFVRSFSYYLEVLRNLSKFDLDKIFIVRRPEFKRRILKFIHKVSLLGFLPRNSINLNRLTNKIERIKRPRLITKWGEYHSNVNKDELFQEGGRFDLIIKLLKEYNIIEVLEIGGNHGLLSFELSKFIDKVICTDYDEVAVDIMFLNARSINANITPVLLDIIHPVYLSTHFAEKLKPLLRFKSQTTLVLAVTHHLILGQKVPIDQMFQIIISYTKEYSFIEFMPNGIDKSLVPTWYTIDWFRENFEKYFELILETPSVQDGNRILFFGKIKTTDRNS